MSGGQSECEFGLHKDLPWSDDEQDSVFSFPDKSDTRSATPKGRNAWLTWAGNKNSKPDLGCDDTQTTASACSDLVTTSPLFAVLSLKGVHVFIHPFLVD